MTWFRRICVFIVALLLATACAVDTSSMVAELAATPIADGETRPITGETPMIADAPTDGQTDRQGSESGSIDLVGETNAAIAADNVLNEAAAWDAMVIELYVDAGGIEPPIHAFAVAAGGRCLELVTDEQTEWMFPANPTLGEAIRGLSEDDCARQVHTFMGNGPSGAETWTEMLDLRFSRTVPFGTVEDFERRATDLCASGGFPSTLDLTQHSSSVELEIYGMYNSGECGLYDLSLDADTDTPSFERSAPESAPADVGSGNRIFFQTGVNHDSISVMDMTTGDTHLLLVGIGPEANVSVSGEQLAFTRDEHVFVINTDGTDELQLSGGKDPASVPVISPDGSSVVYRETVVDGPAFDNNYGDQCSGVLERLVVATTDGAQSGPLTSFASNTLFNHSAQSPEAVIWQTDGRITFVASEDCSLDFEIRTVNLGSGDADSLLTIDSAIPQFSVSPVNGRLAVAGIDERPEGSTASRDGNIKLYIQAEGTNKLRSVDGVVGPITQITWSPNGEWIAFLAATTADSESSRNLDVLYVVSSDGSDIRSLTSTTTPHKDMRFRWSPDSDRLVYSYDVEDQRADEMAIMDLDGNSRVIGAGSPIAWR